MDDIIWSMDKDQILEIYRYFEWRIRLMMKSFKTFILRQGHAPNGILGAWSSYNFTGTKSALVLSLFDNCIGKYSK